MELSAHTQTTINSDNTRINMNLQKWHENIVKSEPRDIR